MPVNTNLRFVADAFPREFTGGKVGKVLISVMNVNPTSKASLVREDWFEFELSAPWGKALAIAANVVVNSPSNALTAKDLKLTVRGTVLRADYVGAMPAAVQPGEGYAFVLKFVVPSAFAYGTLSVRASRQAARIDPISPLFIALASLPASGPTVLDGANLKVNNSSIDATGGVVTTHGGTVNSGIGTTVNVGAGATINLPPGWSPPLAPAGPNFLQVAARKWHRAASLQRVTLPSVAGAMAFDGNAVWVATHGASGLVRVDVALGSTSIVPLSQTPVAGAIALPDPVTDMVYDGTKFWVCGFNQGLVVRPDGQVVSMDAPGAARGCLLFDGRWVWASDGSSAIRVDASALHLRGGFAAGSSPTAMVHDGANVWVLSGSGGNGRLARIAAHDLQPGATRALDFEASAMVFDGIHLWLAARADGAVHRLKYDPQADVCLPSGSFPCGSGPCALLFDGTSLWVANESSSDLTQLRAADGARLGTWPVDASPRAMAFDGINLWVGSGQNAVLRRL